MWHPKGQSKWPKSGCLPPSNLVKEEQKFEEVLFNFFNYFFSSLSRIRGVDNLTWAIKTNNLEHLSILLGLDGAMPEWT